MTYQGRACTNQNISLLFIPSSLCVLQSGTSESLSGLHDLVYTTLQYSGLFYFAKLSIIYIDMDTPNYYAIIPANVRYCDDICANAKLLYGEITALCNAKGYCYASNKYFAELYKLKRPQTISDWVKQLEKNGFVSVELVYQGKEIAQRLIRIAPAETLEVQRKNVIPNNEKTLQGTTKKRCNNNTRKNNKEELTNVGVGNFQLPCPEKEKKEFSDWLGSIGLTRLSQTRFFLKEEKSCAKKEEIGEARFLGALTAIDEYLAINPDFLHGSPDFDKVLQKFITPPSLFAAQSAFSSFFATKYGQSYKSYTKADNAALNKILKALESQPEAKHLSVQDRVNQFFEALAHLPQFDNPLKAKISFISADIFQILAALKKPNFGVGSFVETYKERDARNQMEQHKAQRSRIEEQCFYQQEKEQILRFLENDIPLTDAMKSTQAYKDIFGATPF